MAGIVDAQIEKAAERARVAKSDARFTRKLLEELATLKGSIDLIEIYDSFGPKRWEVTIPPLFLALGNIHLQKGKPRGAPSSDIIINLAQPPVSGEVSALCEALAALLVDISPKPKNSSGH